MKSSTQALIVVDMQRGLFGPDAARHDPEGLVLRLNRLAAKCAGNGELVVYVQHEGPEGDALHPSQAGHALHAGLNVSPGSVVVKKSSCDSFLHSDLDSILRGRGITKLIVTGCATEFCVDTTVRSALARGYKTIVPSDGHTTSDRPHLAALKIIEHHNATWGAFISPAGAAQIRPSEEL